MAEKQALDLRFGWGRFRPSWLQFMNHINGFMVFLTIYSMTQGMIVNGFTSVNLPALEKRFEFTGKELGLIASSNEVSQIILVGFISYYGSYGNKVKWIGYGCLLAGISCILFDLPHLLVGPYVISKGPSNFGSLIKDVCKIHENANSTIDPSCSSVQENNWYYLMIFSVSQILIGAGTSSLYSLGPAFVDENVHPKSAPVYLSVWFAATMLGPGIGYMAGGALLGIFVDGTPPAGLNLHPRDPRWIGAWWIGFLIGGSILIICSIGILGYPRELPGSKEMRKKAIADGDLPKNDEKIRGKVNEIIPASLKLFKNPTYMFNTLGLCVAGLIGGGMSGFFTKILLTKFSMHPMYAGLIISAAFIPGTVGGVLAGGFLCRRFKLKKSCKLSAKYSVILELISTILLVYLFIPGCQTNEMVGVTQPYNTSVSSEISLMNTCNKDCSCSIAKMNPVCGGEGKTFFSPCHAGCKNPIGKTGYGNCSCIPSSIAGSGRTVTKGFCNHSSSCVYLVPFMLLLGFHLFFVFLSGVPTKMVLLRCVPENQRGYALGLQFVFVRLLGFLPGPLFYGALFDESCAVWGKKCKRKGSCQYYFVDKLFNWLGGSSLVIGGIAFVFFYLSYWFCKPCLDDPNDNEKNGASSSHVNTTDACAVPMKSLEETEYSTKV
ncbi:solute carrier organic anion transporter family member 4A1-like isoform X2 [Actinia tenebrosa]|nr:solute carrier organic anion transporter family member 4A1-like isoform X2 [Actinia tenebrosa]